MEPLELSQEELKLLLHLSLECEKSLKINFDNLIAIGKELIDLAQDEEDKVETLELQQSTIEERNLMLKKYRDLSSKLHLLIN
jgi:hypothetical protein